MIVFDQQSLAIDTLNFKITVMRYQKIENFLIEQTYSLTP